MTAKLTNGSFTDSVLTLSTSFYTTAGTHVTDKTYVVTKSVELTPAPVDIYVYHSTAEGADSSCDFKLRKDTN
jgi:hypothetical protein